jgi:hypothetical protein
MADLGSVGTSAIGPRGPQPVALNIAWFFQDPDNTAVGTRGDGKRGPQPVRLGRARGAGSIETSSPSSGYIKLT